MTMQSPWLAVLGVLFLPAPSLASAQPAADPNCRDDRGVDRCAEAQQGRVRALFGMRPIEEHRAAGDQARRVFYVDGYGRDLIAIAFVRARGQDPTLWVHYPQVQGERRSEPLRAPVPLAVWEDILRRSHNFERSFAPRPGADPAASICLHSWVYTIEAADPATGYRPASLRRKTEDSCEGGPGGIYAREMERAALALIPHCAALDPAQHRNPASMLAACRILRGDRLAAAEALNRAGVLRRMSTPAEMGLMHGRFGYRAVIDWNGARNEGQGSALAFWIRKVGEEGRPSLFFEAVEGESADRVRLIAMLSRSLEVPEGRQSRYERARVEQIWVRDAGGDFEIEQVTVGPWAASRSG